MMLCFGGRVRLDIQVRPRWMVFPMECQCQCQLVGFLDFSDLHRVIFLFSLLVYRVDCNMGVL
jgi:hypothetical protein